ncbi:LysR family transcriptional regulator [Shewanella eurypsychrophilus]|uniref:LysR family transcriptional regulator n=1 Tax=Shewanella eurypsychrophilus TaxID=2593656 RepID=A0ABX6V7J3_9GAMM|nr:MULTISPECIES: LysR family transcriptional regulator [Shewanella]QFU23385.1 LysR family transcriptional regulator [Shewanella sp. YLB-09]QPG58615.1 LysR family transcriptional regulator [Shewanella eurypsychrophilus]
MDIRQLKHLDALAKEANFTKAAQRLNMAQPALSQSIKRLEISLGVTLVNRTSSSSQRGKQISLTAEGKALHQHAILIIKQLKQAEAHIKSMANLTKGEVRIGVPGMLGSFYLPSRLMAFRHQYPDLKLSLFEGGTRDSLKMLAREEVDIAIITANDLSPEFDSHLLLSEQMVVAMAYEHPLADNVSIRLEQFFEHELVMFKPGYFHREWMLSQAKALSLTANIAFETNLINLIKQVVSQGYAITSVLEMAISDKDEILAKPFEPAVYLDLHIAWKKQRPISQADRAFVEFLMKNR